MNADEVTIELAASHGASGVGVVVEVGEHAATFLGKRVLVGPIDACGECEVCRRGGAPVCPTAKRRVAPLGARVVAAARWIVALDAAMAIDDALAARVPGDIATAYTLYARANLAPREPTVVVAADDDFARYLVQILIAKAIVPTVVAAPGSAIASFAAEAGAQVARVERGATDDEARAAVRATFEVQQIGNRPWRVLAASIEPALVARAAALANPRATLAILAGSPALPAELAAREVTVIAVATAHPDLVVETAALCVKGQVR